MRNLVFSALAAGLLALVFGAAPASAGPFDIQPKQMPAFTGDCATSAGAVSLTCSKIKGMAARTPSSPTCSGAVSLDVTAYDSFHCTLTGNTTFSLANVTTGSTWSIWVIGAGTYSITWPAGITWQNGATPAPSAGVLLVVGCKSPDGSAVECGTGTSTSSLNYSTWDSVFKNSGVTLSNSNVTATASSSVNYITAGSTFATAAGKYYFEITLSNGGSFSEGYVGVCDSEQPISGTDLVVGHSGTHGIAVQISNGNVQYNGSTVTGGTGIFSALTAGDRVDIALDVVNSKIWFAKNGGAWNGSSVNHPNTGVGGFTQYSMTNTGIHACLGLQANESYTANFGASAMTDYSSFTDLGGFTSGFGG